MNLKMLALSILGAIALINAPAKAQVTSNQPSTAVFDTGAGYIIQDFAGQQRNLFHSFSKFDTSSGKFVNFIVNPNIANVIGRVTDAPTTINGAVTITSNGTSLAPGVNLFLLSPQGIRFGPNAITNIDGAFVASTADALTFEDGSHFSADTTTAATLTISTPVGLQMGDNPAPVEVRGINHNLPTLGFNSLGRGQNILLLGGNIDLIGNSILAVGGRVQLAGLSEAGTISLSSRDGLLRAALPESIARADISLSQGAQILASGPEESVSIIAGHLTLSSELGGTSEEQTAILSGALPGLLLPYRTGDINIDATGDVRLVNSNIYNAIAIGATGRIGDINFKSRSLYLTDSSQIATTGLGTGDSGNLNVEVEQNIFLDGKNSRPDRLTGLYSLLGDLTSGTGSGQAGNLTLKTGSLDMVNGALVSASTLGQGNAGKTTIIADERISVDGISSVSGVASSISSSVEFKAKGDGGNIDITTPLLALSRGGAIFGRTQGDGNAGSIAIKVDALDISSGGQVVTTSFTEGAAGDIEIVARDRVRLTGRDNTYQDRVALTEFNALGGESSGIYANTDTSSTGSSGSISIKTGQLLLSDTAQLSASSRGTGSAGALDITAAQVQLNRSTIQAESRNGDRGNIKIASPILLLRDLSQITTNATGNATGGNIALDTDLIIATGNSDIVARATQGVGGNIDIASSGLFGIVPRPELTSSNDINASSELGVNGTVAINNPRVDPDSGLTELPANPTDSSDQLTAGCSDSLNNFVASGRGGLPQNPLRMLVSNRPWQDTRAIAPSSIVNHGNLQLLENSVENSQVESEASISEAMTWNRNSNNEVVLAASTASIYSQQPTTCASR